MCVCKIEKKKPLWWGKTIWIYQRRRLRNNIVAAVNIYFDNAFLMPQVPIALS